MDRNNNIPIIAIIAFIIAVIALIVAWMAYNRAGVDLGEQLGQEAAELGAEVESSAATAAEETEQAAARLEARGELLALQAQLEAEENYDAAVSEVTAVEADLEEAYADASMSARQDLARIRTEFDQLEQSLREGTADSLEVLGGLILMLGEDARTDER